MKKYVIKATALAIGALVGGAAVASVDFSASPFVATTDTFASELNYAATTGTAISGAKDVVTKLGFGVSAGQTRFIRINLTGAKLAADAAGADVANTTGNTFKNVIVAEGGVTGDSFIIYQVTGNDVAVPSGHGAGDKLTITLPNLNVTNGNASAVNVSYTLYADPVAAHNETAGQSLANQSGTLFSFGTGIKFKITTKTQTATVADAYKKFGASGYGAVDVGSFDFGVSGAFKATGAAAAITDLVGATTKIKFTGDFTFTDGNATPANLFLATAGNCAAGVTALTSIATDNLSASYTVGAALLNKSLCVINNNGAGITPVVMNAQTFSVDLNPSNSAVGTGSSVTDPSAVTLGAIDHDGTTLTAPFATIHPDYLSRVVLNSSYGADAPVTATVTAENGATCSGAPFTATLKKKSQLVINVKDICPSLSSGATRMAVTVSVAAPRANIDGVYNVMNYDSVTGKTNSLISYVMVVPGSN